LTNDAPNSEPFHGRVTLDRIEKMFADMERRFPRKTTPTSLRMAKLTWHYIKGHIQEAMRPPLSQFEGLRVIPDESKEFGIVEVLNRDGEVIRTITL
jgi:hypothetical protein